MQYDIFYAERISFEKLAFLRSEEKYFRKIERGVLLTFEELWDRLFWYEVNKQMHLLLKWYREREGI